MATFMSSFTWDQDPTDEFCALMPTEQENVRKLMAEGKLPHLFFAEDEEGGWEAHNGESPEAVQALMETNE
jgi:hypothetical protein